MLSYLANVSVEDPLAWPARIPFVSSTSGSSSQPMETGMAASEEPLLSTVPVPPSQAKRGKRNQLLPFSLRTGKKLSHSLLREAESPGDRLSAAPFLSGEGGGAFFASFAPSPQRRRTWQKKGTEKRRRRRFLLFATKRGKIRSGPNVR